MKQQSVYGVVCYSLKGVPVYNSNHTRCGLCSSFRFCSMSLFWFFPPFVSCLCFLFSALCLFRTGIRTTFEFFMLVITSPPSAPYPRIKYIYFVYISSYTFTYLNFLFFFHILIILIYSFFFFCFSLDASMYISLYTLLYLYIQLAE